LLCDKRSVEPLCVAVKDADATVRWMAVRALGLLGHRWALNTVISALRDRNVKVREEAAVTLQKLSKAPRGRREPATPAR